MKDFDLEQFRYQQPLFTKVVCLLGAILYCLHLVAVAVGTVIALLNGTFFQHPISEVFGGSPSYWAVFNTCVIIATVLVGGFAILCLVSFIIWIYRTITKQSPVPRANPDVTIKKLSPLYCALVSYGVIFFGTTFWGVATFGNKFITELTKDGNSFGIGMLVLVGPFVLVACVSIIATVLGFCLVLVPGAALTKQMLRYITRPTSKESITEWD